VPIVIGSPLKVTLLDLMMAALK